MKLIKSFFTELSDFIYPRLCFLCKSDLKAEDTIYICNSCELFLEPLRTEERQYYHKHYLNKYYIKSFLLYQFDDISQEYLHILKYKHGKKLGIYMGKQIGNFFKSEIQESNIQAILPCPLYKSKLFERDYNQSEFLAKGLSKSVNIPVLSGIIKRRKKTKTQTKLSRKERLKNIDAAFVVSGEVKNYKSLIILDDVITTGATINEIARSILELNPDIKLYAAAFASPV